MTTTFRIAGFDLGGAHLGCVALEVSRERGVTLVKDGRITIEVGEVVMLPEPVVRQKKGGGTWTQVRTRLTGPEAFERAGAEGRAWALAMGCEVAAVEWTKDLFAGSHSPVLHAGQVGQALYGELRRAGVIVELYGRATALALVRRLAVVRGAPVLPGVVKHRGAELGPVLAALVGGWAESVVERRGTRTGTKEESDGRGHVGQVLGDGSPDGGVEVPTGDVQDARACVDDGLRDGGDRVDAESHEAHRPVAPSGEDRRPEHEIDACAVALAHAAHLAGITVVAPAKRAGAKATGADGAAPVGWRARAKLRYAEAKARGEHPGRLPGAACKRCIRGDVEGPSHRKDCPKWKKWAA